MPNVADIDRAAGDRDDVAIVEGCEVLGGRSTYDPGSSENENAHRVNASDSRRRLTRRRATGRPVTGLAEEGGTVLEDRIDLPPFAVRRAVHPEFVLLGVATGRATLVDRDDTSISETMLLEVDVVRRRVLDPEVIQRAAAARVFE